MRQRLRIVIPGQASQVMRDYPRGSGTVHYMDVYVGFGESQTLLSRHW